MLVILATIKLVTVSNPGNYPAFSSEPEVPNKMRHFTNLLRVEVSEKLSTRQ